MLAKTLIEDIEYHKRVIYIHESSNLTVYEGDYDISTIDTRILKSEVITYQVKIERGIMYLDIYI